MNETPVFIRFFIASSPFAIVFSLQPALIKTSFTAFSNALGLTLPPSKYSKGADEDHALQQQITHSNFIIKHERDSKVASHKVGYLRCLPNIVISLWV